MDLGRFSRELSFATMLKDPSVSSENGRHREITRASDERSVLCGIMVQRELVGDRRHLAC